MKPSQYNYVTLLNNDRYLVYNTLHGSILEVDKEGRNILQSSSTPTFCLLNKETKDLLSQNGFIVPQKTDELRLFKTKFEKFKYDTNGLLFTLITTYECNLNCPYCYEGNKEKNKAGLTSNHISIILNFITSEVIKRNSKNFSLFLFGGEPLLNPMVGINVAQILQKWADELKINFHMGLITNGTLINQRMIDEFSVFKRIFTEITLDGFKAGHDKKKKYHNGEGTYQDIITVLKKCKDSPFDVKIKINIDKENYREIPLVFDDLLSEGLEGARLTLAVLSPLTHACSSYRPYLDMEEIVLHIPVLWEKALERGFRLDISPKSTPVYCGSITESAFIIDPYLDIYKCFGSVGIKEHRVGHLLDDGRCRYDFAYYDLLSRDPLLFSDDTCTKCVKLPICGGGCAFASFVREGTYHSGSCDFLSKILDQRIILYWKYKDRIDKGL